MNLSHSLSRTLIASILALCTTLATASAQSSQQDCQDIKARYDLESYATRVAFYHLQTARQGGVDLDRAWQNQHELNVGSNIIDFSFLVGSVLTKPLAAAFGVALVRQTAGAALIEASLTGIAKSSVKDFQKILLDYQVDPADALAAATGKAAEGGAKKAFEEFTKNVLTKKLIANFQSGGNYSGRHRGMPLGRRIAYASARPRAIGRA